MVGFPSAQYTACGEILGERDDDVSGEEIHHRGTEEAQRGTEKSLDAEKRRLRRVRGEEEGEE